LDLFSSLAEKNPHRRVIAPIDGEGLTTYFSLMPKISLVVCLYREKDLLERLLKHLEGCYDDLVVVHDGAETSGFPSSQTQQTSPEQLSLSSPQAPPFAMARDYGDLSRDSTMPPGYRFRSDLGATGTIQELVQQYKGSFYEGPRCFQQEPHWPFAWWASKYDWILRLDADEYPSDALRIWIQDFRRNQASLINLSGFTAIWPLWDGKSDLLTHLPPCRPFLINRRKVSFLGMVEQGPIPDFSWQPCNLVLHHRPRRKSFGPGNLLFRKQAYSWRKCIASSLVRHPQNLPSWRYHSNTWPVHWEQIQQTPWRIGPFRFIKSFFYDLVIRRRKGLDFIWEDTLATAIHQLLLAWSFAWLLSKRSFLKRKER
jgi:hypothetical protein